MKHLKLFEDFISEGSKEGLTKTTWSKFPNSKHGDLILSRRQGVIAIRDGEVLRPIHAAAMAPGQTHIVMDRGYETDKQFTEIVEPNAEAIAKAFLSMSSRTTKEAAEKYGNAVEKIVDDFKK